MNPTADTPGPEGAALGVATYLTEVLPDHLDDVCHRAGVERLDDPAHVTNYDPGEIGLEEWPYVIVQAPRTRRIEFIGVETHGTLTHRVTYAVEVLVWVRDDGAREVSLAAMRYGTAVRQALLDRPQLTAWRSEDPGAAVVMPETITEDRSPVTPAAAGGRTMAGVLVAFDVWRLETTPAPEPYGRADTATVTADTVTAAEDLPPHPGLM